MSVFAIGDIHGCYHALKSVIHAAEIQTGDTIVLLGDLISKGPNSREVIEWVIENREKYHIITLKGNHEDLMLKSRNTPTLFEEWMGKGGEAVMESYGISVRNGWQHKIPGTHWRLLESSLHFWSLENFIFVHAGVIPGIPLEEQTDHTLLWRKYRNPVEYAPGVKVIYGHTALKDGEIGDFGHSICLDTYAYGGQWLSCLNVHTRKYWQAKHSGVVREGKLL